MNKYKTGYLCDLKLVSLFFHHHLSNHAKKSRIECHFRNQSSVIFNSIESSKNLLQPGFDIIFLKLHDICTIRILHIVTSAFHIIFIYSNRSIY